MYAFIQEVFNAIEPLSGDEWEQLKSKLSVVNYQKKERLLELNQVANHYFFINEGLVRLHGYKEGEDKTLFFFKEGMLAGSIQSYLENEPSRLALEALEPTQALRISKADLDTLFQSSPAMVKIGLVLTQTRFQKLLHFFSSFVLDSPEERYHRFVEREPDLFNRVPQHLIASFLGVTPVSLSRIRKRIYDKR